MVVAAARKSAKPLLVVLAIFVTAALLMVPAALGPLRLNDSFWIDWVWLDQFARELGNGVLYPRWLPLSHDRLGSPVFYYYPPLAFYAASLFILVGLAPYAALLTTFLAGYAITGATMYWWLKPQANKPLLGALVFMVAPYHVFNFYNRGAIAEFMATAILPLVMVGLWRIKHEKAGGFAVAAMAYAALICAHPPLALLTSLFLIGPLIIVEGYKAPRGTMRPVAALATGIALAAIYWLPAILLEPYRDSAKLWANPVLQPHNWSFWNPEFVTSPGYVAVLVISAALALPLVSLLIRYRSQWTAYGLVCVLLAIGVIPSIWNLPLLRAVQFPFRLLPLAEFALATAMANIAWRTPTLGAAITPLLAISGFIMAAAPANQGVSLADMQARHPDVPENLPPGPRPYSWPSRWALNVASSHRQPQFKDGVTVEPIFYFPAWRVTCEGRRAVPFPEQQTQLLAYRGRNCSRHLAWTTAEKLGAAVSLLGLVVLLIASAAGLTRRNA